MPQLRKLRTLAAQTETTVGTAETLAADDGVFNAYNLDIQGDIQVEEREGQGGFDMLPGVAGRRGGSLSFTTDIEWDGTATVPVWASTLFPSCGWVNSSGTFTPRSEAPGTNVKTCTIGVFEDGVFKKLAGAVGTFQIFLPSGRKCYINWNFQGVWQAVTDSAIIEPTYPTDTIVRFASATTTYDSVALCVEQMTIDAGNNIILRECASTDGGYISGLITSRYPTIEANPEATLVATDDPYGDWLAGNEAALSVVLDGPSDSDITISAPKAQIFNAQEGDRDGLMVDNLTWQCNKNNTTHDQCLSIVFNEAT